MPDIPSAPEPDLAEAPGEDDRLVFAILNEIGIIQQLAATLLEARLPDGMVVRHFGVLSHLSRRPEGRTPLAMAQAFEVPKTSMTHTVAGLESRGYVEVRRNPDDGRSKLVVITPEGRALIDGAVAALGPEMAEIRRALGSDRLTGLHPLLVALRQHLDAARD